MTMLDERCWNCAIIEEGLVKEKFFYLIYQGKGIFKCEHCGEVSDHSKIIYSITIRKGKDFLIASKCDSKMDRDVRVQFNEDLFAIESQFDEEGEYDCDIIWYWYKSGGDEPEWDFTMDVITKQRKGEASSIPPTSKEVGILEAI